MIKQPDQSKVEHYPIQTSYYLNDKQEYSPHNLYVPQKGKQQGPSISKHYQHSYARQQKKLRISQVNTQKQQCSIWDIFKCCKEVKTQETEFDDCYVCNRRVYHNNQPISIQQTQDVPYTSVYRMRNRQQQPVQVFYDKLKNHELRGDRWAYQ